MKDSQKKACVYVAQQYYIAVDKVYNELYGEWKHEGFRKLGIKVPDRHTFAYDMRKLLPVKYMEGQPNQKPNALFKALRRNDMNKACSIITKAQFYSVSEFASFCCMDYEYVRKQIRSIWAIMTERPQCKSIPKIALKKYLDYINGENEIHGCLSRYSWLHEMGNFEVVDGFFEMYELVAVYFLVCSKDKEELNNLIATFLTARYWLYELAKIWNIYFPLGLALDRTSCIDVHRYLKEKEA